ncbi:GNAT family N-acetyltransferase [Streptomyces sp. NPDC005438]|uniref:GNAT family N-acetyltransferase n=1 Tax=Streptomyces sp. NPDC005438 TaxID=3156880 RepID=UPI0033B7D6A4
MTVTLTTPRLRLRPLTTADLPDYLALHDDPRVYGPTVGRPYTREEATDRLRRNERQWKERGHGLYAVELADDGAFVGRCGLVYWERFDEVEAGWSLHPDHWGRGLATEAARAFLDQGWRTLTVPYVTSMIRSDNEPSAAVARRLGFTPLRPDRVDDIPVIVHALQRP